MNIHIEKMEKERIDDLSTLNYQPTAARPVRFQKPDRSIEVNLFLEKKLNDDLTTLKELLR